MRKLKKIFICSFYFSLLFAKLSGQVSEEPSISVSGSRIFAASKEVALEDSQATVIRIKTNIANAEVYINGAYQGYSPVKMENLHPGKYRLEVRKQYYNFKPCTIVVREGYDLTYEVVLEEMRGRIEFHELPSDAQVFVDGTRIYSDSKELIAGEHKIKINRFGYNSYVQNIVLEPDSVFNVTPEFEDSAFELSDYKSSREFINPDVKGTLGKTKISFKVTNYGSAKLYVYATEGSITNSYEFEDFKTWNQSYIWNGISDTGEKLGDGLYCFELQCNEKIYKVYAEIDYSKSYSTMNFSEAGFGYGNLPAIEKLSMKYTSVSLGFSPEFSSTTFSTMGVESGISGFINENISLGLKIRMDTKTAVSLPFCLSGNFRFSKSFPLVKSKSENQIDFNAGFFCRYGFALNMPETPVRDYGAGSGGGLLLGFDFYK